jgi:GTPase SAR1 family protein
MDEAELVREMISTRLGPGSTELDLSHLQLKSLGDVTPAELRRLISLDLSNNDLTEIPPVVFALRNLATLKLGGNPIRDIPNEIHSLSALRHLDLSNNSALKTISPEIASLELLESLDLGGSEHSLRMPPPEVVIQGADAIRAYYGAEGLNANYTSKLVIVGEGGAGKTSLLKTLKGLQHNPSEPTTHGLAVDTLELNHPTKLQAVVSDPRRERSLRRREYLGRRSTRGSQAVLMRLRAWDFGGQEIYHATHQFFFSERALFLLVWNARLGWEQGRLDYWLDLIQAKAPGAPIIVIATHTDERPAELPDEELQARYPQISAFHSVSNVDRVAANVLRSNVANLAANLPLMGDYWPRSWSKSLEAIRKLPQLHASPQALYSLMSANGVNEDSQHVLLQVMHHLGDALHFDDDDQLQDIVILRPQWLTEYVARVLDSEEVKNAKGVLTKSHMSYLWSDIEPSLRQHFLRLMEKFDLSYRTLEDEDISLIVERLSLNQADYRRRWDGILSGRGSTVEVTIRYHLSSIPPGVPTWFIARSHRFTTNTHWRTGALFAKRSQFGPEREQLGLVKSDRVQNTITLSVRGNFPQEFFAILKDGLEVTFRRYPGLDVRPAVPCSCKPSCNHEYDLGDLERRLVARPPKTTIECPKTMLDADVQGMLFGIRRVTASAPREVLNRLSQMENNIRSEIVTAKQDELAEIASMRLFMARESLRAWRRDQRRLEVECPSLFTLVPKGRVSRVDVRSIVREKLLLQLYCEMPGKWHPTAGGEYEVSDPADWWRKLQPYIEDMLKILKMAAPLAAPLVGIASSTLWDENKHQLKLMEEVVKALPLVADEDELVSRREEPVQYSDELRPRAFLHLLRGLDAREEWGGLRATATPEGDVYWLCSEHSQEIALGYA